MIAPLVVVGGEMNILMSKINTIALLYYVVKNWRAGVTACPKDDSYLVSWTSIYRLSEQWLPPANQGNSRKKLGPASLGEEGYL
jgi:hypothetical protein